MKIKRKDIKVGNYIALGNKPWFESAFYRGEDKRTVDQMRHKQIEDDKAQLALPVNKRITTHDAHYLKRRIKQYQTIYYFKVVSTKNLTYLYKPWGTKESFKLKWITDVCQNYKEVMQKGGRR